MDSLSGNPCKGVMLIEMTFLHVIETSRGHTCSYHLEGGDLLQLAEEIHIRQSYYAARRTFRHRSLARTCKEALLETYV